MAVLTKFRCARLLGICSPTPNPLGVRELDPDDCRAQDVDAAGRLAIMAAGSKIFASIQIQRCGESARPACRDDTLRRDVSTKQRGAPKTSTSPSKAPIVAGPDTCCQGSVSACRKPRRRRLEVATGQRRRASVPESWCATVTRLKIGHSPARTSSLPADPPAFDDVHAMAVVRAVLTEIGGATSHAAVVSRELQVPCVGLWDRHGDAIGGLTCHGRCDQRQGSSNRNDSRFAEWWLAVPGAKQSPNPIRCRRMSIGSGAGQRESTRPSWRVPAHSATKTSTHAVSSVDSTSVWRPAM